MISFFYLIVQLCTLYACVTLALHNFGPNNWLLLLCLLPLYLVGKEANIAFWRLLGYHPEPQTRTMGTGRRRIVLPVFVKTSPDYASLYSSRHKGFQFLFTFLRILIWGSIPALIFLSLGLCMLLQIPAFFALIFGVLFLILVVKLEELLQARFQKWFALEVCLVERGLPIFRKKEINGTIKDGEV